MRVNKVGRVKKEEVGELWGNWKALAGGNVGK